MKQTTQIPIEHIVVTSDHSYEQVIAGLEAQLGSRADWDTLQQVMTTNATFEQAVQLIEQQLGTSGFTIFSKLEPGALLRLSGKPTRAVQYAIGNPLLAIQMIEHAPEAALYAPLRLVVYENRRQSGGCLRAFHLAACPVSPPGDCTGHTACRAKTGSPGR